MASQNVRSALAALDALANEEPAAFGRFFAETGTYLDVVSGTRRTTRKAMVEWAALVSPHVSFKCLHAMESEGCVTLTFACDIHGQPLLPPDICLGGVLGSQVFHFDCKGTCTAWERY